MEHKIYFEQYYLPIKIYFILIKKNNLKDLKLNYQYRSIKLEQ